MVYIDNVNSSLFSNYKNMISITTTIDFLNYNFDKYLSERERVEKTIYNQNKSIGGLVIELFFIKELIIKIDGLRTDLVVNKLIRNNCEAEVNLIIDNINNLKKLKTNAHNYTL